MAIPARLTRLRPIAKSFQRPLQSTSHQLLYHSYNHPAPPGPFTATETQILTAATQHIPEHGFTAEALSLGAKDVGYLDASLNLFPSGAFSLVLFHLYTQRLALAQLGNILQPETPTGVGSKVKALTWERLMANRDVIEQWQEALALMASPRNVSPSLHELSLLADEIWFLAGDVSVDTSWYTKRASLSTIYAATDVFMTTDKSQDFKDTREFMDRRFEDSRKLGGMVGNVGQWVGFTASATVNILRSKGVRI